MSDTSNPTPLPTVREQTLVREASHVLATTARQVARKFPRLVNEQGLLAVDDLVSIGRQALYECARRFRDEYNHDFADFARRRVRGAMLNALHDLLYEERIQRAALVAGDNYCAFHRDDTYNVLEHGYPEEATRRYRDFANGLVAATFAAAVEEATRSTGTADLAQRQEYELAARSLRDALARLEESDQKLLVLVYRDLHDLKTTSSLLGIPYSTLRRRHDNALRKLREQLVGRGVERAPPRVASLDDVGGVIGLGDATPGNDHGSKSNG